MKKKSNYEEALKNIVKEINAYKLHGLGDKNWMGVQDIMQNVSIIEQAFNELERLKKVEKLLVLYEKLAEHRLIAVNKLLNDIIYIKYRAKHHGEEDAKIVEEIAEIKEIENDKV